MTAVIKSQNSRRYADAFSLRRQLSVVSLLVMLVTASTLIFLYRGEQLEEHTAIAAADNAKTLTYLTRVLDEQLSGFISNEDRTPQATASIDALLSAALAAIRERDALKLKLYTPSGAVIYSSARSEIGGGSVHPEFLAMALRGKTVHGVEFRKVFFGKDGEMRNVYVALTYMPLMHDGKRIGVIELYDDVTPVFKHLQVHIVEIALIVFGAFAMLYAALYFAVSRADRSAVRWQKNIIESEAALRESQHIASMGSYVLDIPSGVWKSSGMLDQLFGIDDTYEHTLKGWEALVHPDDRAMMADYLKNEVLGQAHRFDKEFRIVRHSDQAVRWVHALGRLEFDAQGSALKMHGTLQDITRRKRMKAQLHYSESRFRALMEQSPLSIQIFTPDGYTQSVNRAWENMWGLTLDALAQYNILQDRQLAAQGAMPCIEKGFAGEATEVPAVFYEMDENEFVHGSSRKLWVRAYIYPLKNATGEIQEVALIHEDISESKRAEQALFESSERLRAQKELLNSVLETALDAVVQLNAEGIITGWNRQAEKIFGWAREEAIGRLMHEIIVSERFRDKYLRGMKHFIDTGEGEMFNRCIEIFALNRDGREFPVEFSISLNRTEDGYAFSAFIRDITKRKLAEEAWRVAAVAFETNEAILITDANSTIVRVNRAFSEITGYSAEDVLGKNPRFMNSGRQDRTFFVEMWQQLLHSGAWAGEIWDKRKNGEIYPKWMTITAVKNPEQETTHYVAIFSDITERKKTEGEIHNLAFYDALTKLPNRRLFLDRLRTALLASSRHHDYGAVLFIDMDRFKALNDSLGHDYGDLMLVEVGLRIKACVREMDTVARYGGDEFVVLIDGLSNDRDEVTLRVSLIAEKIREALALPYNLKGHAHHSSPSIGISLYHGNEESLEMLIEHADMAMYQVKKTGRNAVRFFDPVMQHDMAARDALVNDLHHAMPLQQLLLYFQVQVDRDNRALGAEAFLRWIHPEHGMIMPGQFIPVAEESSLIVEIDRWVLYKVCQQLALWRRNDKTRDLTVTVNISAKLFTQDDFVEEVAGILSACQADPMRLKLELSERLVLTDIHSSMVKINALKQLGIRLSMDNFGTVYSSLSYLKQLSPDQLKIHREFVQGIELDSNDALLVKTVANLAKSLDLGVFAEGVETEAQRSLLESYNCDSYQGYLFGKPVPVEEFEVLLESL